MSNIMSCAWSAALAQVGCDPGSSAVVMQISAEEGGKTGVRSSATFAGNHSSTASPCCSELQFISELGVQNAQRGGGVNLNPRDRFKARTGGDSGLFHVCVFRVPRVSSHSSQTSKNRLLSGVFAHLTGWWRFTDATSTNFHVGKRSCSFS